jgi:hypothetical protein
VKSFKLPVVAFVVVFVVTVTVGEIESVPLALAIDSEVLKSSAIFTGVPDVSVTGNGDVLMVIDVGLSIGASVHVVVVVATGGHIVVPSVKVVVELFSSVTDALAKVIMMLL